MFVCLFPCANYCGSVCVIDRVSLFLSSVVWFACMCLCVRACMRDNLCLCVFACMCVYVWV